MSARSKQIRASRREKQARKWAGNDNARAGTSRSGIAKGSEIGVLLNRLGRPGRQPERRTD